MRLDLACSAQGSDSRQQSKSARAAGLAGWRIDVGGAPVLLTAAAITLDDLRALPSNRLEALHGDRQGQFSIRINMQWQMRFEWPAVRTAHPPLRSWTTTDQETAMRPPIHPGEVLADELAELNITPTELARQLEVPANRLSQIIRGKRSITGDTALRPGHWFGTRPQFWRNLQAAYDIRTAEAAVGAEISRLPVRPWHEKQVGA